MADDYSINTKITGDSSDFDATIEDVTKSLDDLGSSAETAGDKTETGSSKVKEGLSSWGVNIDQIYEKGNSFFKNWGIDIDTFAAKIGTTGPVVAGFVAIGAAAIAVGKKVVAQVSEWVDSFAGFETKMTEVWTLLPNLSEDAFDDMSQQVLDFDKEFGVLSGESVPALYQAISAGVPEDNVFDFLETAQKAAKGGVSDLTSSVDVLTSILNAYGESASEAGDVSDALFVAVRDGKTSFGELSQSIFNVTPTAAAAGVSFDQVAAGLAAITAQGTPTSVATTQMRQLFVELSDSTSAVGVEFEKLTGTSFKDFIAEGGNVSEALSELEKGADDSGIGINELFSSVEAGSAALQLTGTGAEKFNAVLEDMTNKTGATQAAYDKMAATLGQTTAIFKANAETLQISLGNMFGPLAIGIAEAGTSILEVLQALVDKISPILKPVFTIIGNLVSAVFELVSNIVSEVSRFGDEWGIVWQAAGAVLQNLSDTVGPILQTLVNIITNAVALVVDLMTGNWSDAWLRAKLIVLEVVAAILDTVSGMVNSVFAVINSMTSGVNTVLDKFGISLKQIKAISLSETTGLAEEIEKVEADLAANNEKTEIEKTNILEENNAERVKSDEDAAEDRKAAAKELSEFQSKWEDKTLANYISNLEDAEDAAISEAKARGETTEELNKLIQKYDDEELEYYKQTVEKQREISLEEAKEKEADAETVAQINAYYDDKITDYQEEQQKERLANTEDTATTTEKTIKTSTDKIKTYYDDLIEKGDEWNNTFVTVEETLKGAVTDSLENIGEILVTGAGWDDFKDIALEASAEILRTLGEQLLATAALKLSMGDVAAATVAAAGAAASFVAAGAADALSEIDDAAESATSSIQELAASLDISISSSNDFIDAWGTKISSDVIEDNIKTATNAVSSLETKLVNTQTALSNLYTDGDWEHNGAELANLARNYEYYIGIIEGDLEEAEDTLAAAIAYRKRLIAAALADSKDSIKDSQDSMQAYIDLFTEADEATLAYSLTLQQVVSEAESFSSSLLDVGTEISSSLIDNLTDGLTESDFLDTLKEYITSMVIQAAVYTEELEEKMAQIGVKIAKGISSGFSEYGLQDIKEELSDLYSEASSNSQQAVDLISSVFDDVDGFAVGTDFAPGGYALVGEQGPELVNLPRGSQVYTNAETRGMLGGSKSVTVNASFNSPTALNESQMMTKLKNYNRQLSISGVI